MQVKKQQLELDMQQWTGYKLGKEYVKLYIVTLLIWLICRVYHCWEKYQPWYADNITLMAESEMELKILLMKVKEESEKAGLKLSIQTHSSILAWRIPWTV